MADAALVLVAIGILAAGGVTWFLARRVGAWAGLAVPALATAVAGLRAAMPLGHAEEAMGRGLELMMIWAPLVLVTALGWIGGVLTRRR